MKHEVFYAADFLLKHAEQDDINEGCIPETGRDSVVSVTFSGLTVENVIEQIAEFVAVAPEHRMECVERDACGDMGRVDFQVQESDEGLPLTSREEELFRAGKIRTWAVTYTARIYKNTREEVSAALPSPAVASSHSGVVN